MTGKRSMRRIAPSLWILTALAGCVSNAGGPTGAAGPLYFKSPESAVPEITEMLRAKDWKTLARYYRLKGTGVDRASLESGAFFYTEKRPESAGPGDLWKYKHPFAPGFGFVESRPLQTVFRFEVVTMLEIPQPGGKVQRKIRSFLMFESPEGKGYQILPGEAPTR